MSQLDIPGGVTDVEALDRHRLQSNVTRVLSDEWISILSASVTTSRDQVAVSRFTFELRTRSTLVTF